jgi:hypothetical protein
MPSKLADAIAHQEGFYVTGSLPQRQNNPGDLRHAPDENHDFDHPNGIGWFTTPAQGWAALERQLRLYAGRNMTLEAAIYEFAPPDDNNDTPRYLNSICDALGCSADLSVTDALTL